MIRVAIVVGSTRPGRKAEIVARWVYDIASKRSDAEFEVVDILDFNLPLLDEPMSPSRGEYTQPHTKAWSAKIDSFDAFVFVTPEYNHGPSGALKNASDFLYREWNNKAAAFVSYGGASGTRAVEQSAAGHGRAPGRGRARASGPLAGYRFPELRYVQARCTPRRTRRHDARPAHLLGGRVADRTQR